MKKLHIYMIKKFIGPFIVVFFVTTFVLLMQFLFRYLDDIIGKGLEATIIIEVMLYAVCNLIPMAFPLSVLIASIMTYGNLGENNELLAMKAAGISLYKVIMPVAIFSVILSIGAFFFSNEVLPVTNLKFASILHGVKTQRPEIMIKNGTFSNDIDGFSIKVSGRTDRGTLLDILIYNHQNNRANTDVTVADSGYMAMSQDKRYMTLTLFNGEGYVEDQPAKRKDRNRRPLRRDVFRKRTVRVPIEGMEFEKTGEDQFSNNYKTFSLYQLGAGVDTLDMAIEKKAHKYMKKMKFISGLSKQLRVYGMPDSIVNRAVRDTAVVRVLNLDSIYNSLADKDIKEIVYSAKVEAKENSRSVVMGEREISNVSSRRVKFWLEWHRKFTLSIACIIFFFIGAPLGGIIRKGGMGMSLVVSIVLFIFYYVISISIEKMARDGSIPEWQAMWITSLIFAVAGLFLTIRITRDQGFKGFVYINNVVKKIVSKYIIVQFQNIKKKSETMKTLTIQKIKRSPRSLVEAKTLLLSSPKHRVGVLNWEGEFPYKPGVTFHIAHDGEAFFIYYEVEEERMRAVRTEPNSGVYKDSCCEFFFAPDDKGYYNIEINAIGTVLMGYGADGDGRTRLDPELFSSIEVLPTIGTLPIEATEDERSWALVVRIPFSTFVHHPDFMPSGGNFKGNFYKCGDETPIPHFISWSFIDTDSPSFHQPSFFGDIVIE